MLGYREYLDYAERLLSNVRNDGALPQWHLIPATILAWSAIESFVNNMLDDFASLDSGMFQLHERSFLLEQRLNFVNHGQDIGQFVLEGKEYRNLGDKIVFLITKIGKSRHADVKGQHIWQSFERFKKTRDALVHPRRSEEVNVTKKKVEDFIETSKLIIQLVSKDVWQKEVTF